MTIKLISNINSSLYNSKAKHPMQSWEWGEARKKMDIDVLRMGEYSGDALVNVYQATFHKIPYFPFVVGYLPRSDMPSGEVLDELYSECKKRNAIFMKIEPYVLKKDVAKNIYFEKNESIVTSAHPLFPNWTQVLDLTQSEKILLKKMHSKTRYNIGLAQKKGVVVKEMTNEEGFEIFSKLYFDTCKRQGYKGHTKLYHSIIFDALRNKSAHILIAFLDSTPLCAYELFIFNDVLFYPYGGSSTDFRNVMAPNLLMWEAILFGKSKNAKYFDMWGSLPPDYDKNSAWGGFTRFKEGYGGEFVELVGSFDMVINPLLYKAFSVVHKLRRKLI